jgi:hypothetical protein
MKKLVFAILFAAAVALALPQPSDAQGVKGMTLDQYLLMQERVDAFCNYFADGKPFPSAGQGLRIPTGAIPDPGHRLEYVYSQTEAQALIKHCRNLMELMRKARQ